MSIPTPSRPRSGPRALSRFSSASWLAAIVLAGCGGGGGGDTAATPAAAASASTTVHASAAAVAVEPAGKNCAAGGTRIDSGTDLNDSGKLDAAESTTTQYVCNGTVGPAALVRIVAEPAGSHCAQGGSAVAVGVDTNGSAVLDASEVTSTSYICNGSSGARSHSSLVVAAVEAAGSHCAYAGTRITAGLDVNDSGVLDASEVTSTAYSCNGAPGAGSSGAGTVAWTSVTTTSAQMTSNAGYFANNAAQVVLTLPTAPAVGDVVSVLGQGTGGWRIAQNAGQGILVKALPTTLAAGAAWTPHASAQDWFAVASSADGTRLVAAVSGGPLYTSADAGVTWTARDSPRNWTALASSADGTKLVASATGERLYTSVDAGLTWSPRDSPRAWSGVASSADGTRLLAAVQNGLLYTSTDAGATWTARDNARDWSAVASSSDGSRLVATVSGGNVYVSSDSGASWSPQETARAWASVASSSDGTKLVAAVSSGRLFTSSDGGANWTARESSRLWTSVASSADGSRLVASAFNNLLYTSTDAGATWTPRESSRGWHAVASSADGSRLVAAVYLDPNALLYTSVNDRTSTGTAGSLSGGQFDAVDLIYLGNGLFDVRNFSSYTGVFGAS